MYVVEQFMTRDTAAKICNKIDEMTISLPVTGPFGTTIKLPMEDEWFPIASCKNISAAKTILEGFVEALPACKFHIVIDNG